MKFYINILLMTFSLASLSLQAEEIKLYAAHFPPYTIEVGNKKSGAVFDIANEIIKRLELKTQIDFIPWPRARFEAETKKNVIIMPLARTPEREEHYTWLIHVLDDPYVILAHKYSTIDISSIEATKNLRIGILKGSVADSMLRRMGYTNLDISSNDLQNVRKLNLKRLDAWVAPLSAIDQYKDQVGIGKDDLRVGYEFTQLKEYIGASKEFDKNMAQKWIKAFEKMKKDGSYQAIMKKYGMNPLP